MHQTTVALDDNFSIGGVSFLDACNGHPIPLFVGGGDYHYHGIPYCITDDIDHPNRHSRMLGVVRDGFPFYGPQDVRGEEITSADLDECSGHFGPTPEFPWGVYHYHLSEDQAPYSINCYHGEIDIEPDPGPQG